MSRIGRIVAAFGRHYEISLSDDKKITGYPLGKKSAFAVGDEVELEMQGEAQCRILRHQTRRTFLYRSDAWRQKLIAANTTQLILVVATEPDFSDELLARAIIAAESEGMHCLIVLNKCDLLPKLAQAREKLTEYRRLGYEVLEISARQDISVFLAHLHNQSSILVGQSGMGKSTLIQALFPDAIVATREISVALGSGKHTTTHARSYRLDYDSDIIDCPGLQEFGLAHLSRQQIEAAFPELRPHLGKCRFRDCKHCEEPDCAVKAAVSAGLISQRRLALFRRIAGNSN